MNLFEKILCLIDNASMNPPTMYGWFHLLFFAVIIATAVISAILLRKYRSQRIVRLYTFACWVIIVLLEIIKQLIFSISVDKTTGNAVWDYQWYAFPFQFCSSPLYLLPFAAFLPDGAARKGVITFLATFSMFAGSAVLFYPSTVFMDTIFINIQTMVHHGIQIIIGVVYLTFFKEKLNLKAFFLGVSTFAVMATVALGLNLIAPNFTDETFNMFFISPHFESTLPLLSLFYGKVPYPVFLLIYLIGFSLAALIVYYAAKGIEALACRMQQSFQKA